jgi:hypothetical protein
MGANWTSTQFHNWKSDCSKFVAGNKDFEVRDIFTADQESFYVGLCDRSGYTFTRTRQSVMCISPVPK